MRWCAVVGPHLGNGLLGQTVVLLQHPLHSTKRMLTGGTAKASNRAVGRRLQGERLGRSRWLGSVISIALLAACADSPGTKSSANDPDQAAAHGGTSGAGDSAAAARTDSGAASRPDAKTTQQPPAPRSDAAAPDGASPLDADGAVPAADGAAPLPRSLVTLEQEIDTEPLTDFAFSGDTLAINLFAKNGGIRVVQRAQAAWSDRQIVSADVGEGHFVGLSGDTLVTPKAYAEAQVFERGASGFAQPASLPEPEYEEGTGGEYRSVAIDGDTLVMSVATNASPVEWFSVTVFVREGRGYRVQAHLKGSRSTPGDRFGSALAIAGDILVIGAPNEGGVAPGANCLHFVCGPEGPGAGMAGFGAAYVFARSGETWTEQAYLQSDDPTARVRFGAGVAVSGESVLIGAPGEDVKVANPVEHVMGAAGAVYIFTRTGSVWSRNDRVTASPPGTNDRFGESVAVDGTRLVIGSPGQASATSGIDADPTDTLAPFSGAAYLFELTTGGWIQSAFMKAQHAKEREWFGSVVALEGDTLVVGPSYTPGASVIDVFHVTPR